jgi:Nucleotidyltransferase of unknown function (DUF6036)
MDIINAIEELDKLIAKKDLSYVLYTCGGAQLVFLGYTTRRTEDVDLIQDKIDDPLRIASLQVAKKLKIQNDWLNNNVSPLSKRLGKGWKKKTVLLFKGHAITLMGLSRQNLISSKLHAAIDRKGEDYEDLLFLKPNLAEINIAQNYVLNQKNDMKTSEIFIDAWVKELKNDLGYN